MTDQTTQPLAIVGIGCLFPKANNPAEYWANIREGVDTITDIPPSHWDPTEYFDADKTTPDKTYAKRGGFIEPQDFNPLLYGLSPNNIEATDTTQLLGMVVARQALLDAGYSTNKNAPDGRAFDRDRTSVILGVTGTLELVIPLGARLGQPIWHRALADAGIAPEIAADIVKRIADSYVPWQENSFPGLLGNVVAGRIANRFDLGGTNCVVDAACASSLSALHLAALELYTNRADMVITGGMDAFNDIFMYMCFSKTPALSPTANSRPFAKNGDGTILGEGLGAIILKRLDDAKRDGDKIYALLRSVGAASDGSGNAIYAPNANGQTKALQNAYQQAGVKPRSIELVEAHGTGTAIGDTVEATALSAVYSQDNQNQTWCAIGSVKSMIGHTKAAAGVAGIIKIAMALKHKVLPPSIKVNEPLDMITPGTAPIYLNTIKRPWLKTLTTPRRAAVSSFGFGGSNFHCVLEEAESAKTDIEWDGSVLIIALSSNSKAALSDIVSTIPVAASWYDLRWFAYESCQLFQHNDAHRLTIVVQKGQMNLQKTIANITKNLNDLNQNTPQSAWQISTEVYYSNKASTKKRNNIAFVFPGQGAQYVGMGCDLACQFPQFSKVLEAVNQVFMQSSKAHSLVDVLYPIPVFSEAEKKKQELTLRQTQHAQPAIGAVSLGSLAVLRHFGLDANVMMGHSYGELSALAAAGYYDIATLSHLSRLRGELMAAGSDEPGAMLAVIATYAEVETILNEHDIKLIIANHNAPKQIVLSGAIKEIERFIKLLETEKIYANIQTIKLPVATAFHSHFVAVAVAPFATALHDIEFNNKDRLPVLANTTADYYPPKKEAIIKLLSEQLAKPVRFVEQVKRLYTDGIDTFIEVGPGKTLTQLISATLLDKPNTALAIDSSAGNHQGQYDLALLLAKLAANGERVDLKQWDADCGQLQKPARNDAKPELTIKLSGANYRTPKKPRAKTKLTLKKEPDLTMKNDPQDTEPKKQVIATAIPPTSLLKTTQETILALQKMQAQTARLHQQYLEGQDTAQKTIQSLLAQQQQLITGAPLADKHSLHVAVETVTKQILPTVEKITSPVIDQTKRANTIQQETKSEVIKSDVDKIDIDNLLLNVVAEKTGYPLEMLSLDMSLDTDLGIDSIKRVEIFSALQEKLPWQAIVEPEQLGTFQFLQNIVEFIATANPSNKQSLVDDFEQILLEVVADKTGYPVAMLDLEMSLDSDLGIDSIKRVEILSSLQEKFPDLPQIAADDLAALQTLQQIIDYMMGTMQTSLSSATKKKLRRDTAQTENQAETAKIDRYIVRVNDLQESDLRERVAAFNKTKKIWINGGRLARDLSEALKADGYTIQLIDHHQKPNTKLAGLILCPESTIDKAGLLDMFTLVQTLASTLQAAQGFLISISTLGGYFGFNKALVANPVQAGLHGIIKTAAKEWEHVHCKAIDMDPGTVKIAALKKELSLQGPLEVGLCNTQILQPQLEQQTLITKKQVTLFNQNDVIVISGGARGVTAEIAVALAKAYQCQLLLLGRSPKPQADPDWLAGITSQSAIKQAILDHEKTELKPSNLEKRYRSILAMREIRANLERVTQAGSKVQYLSVDVNDVDLLSRVIVQARTELGPVTGLIHAAGILADRLIEDKTVDQFDTVYSTKVDGLQNLLRSTEPDPLKLIALFSSTTARFGRKGQVDYAAANEVLNKIAVQENKRRKDCKVLSVNWGPWDGGMVTPALKKLFAQEGIGLIDLEAGAHYFIDEIESSGPVETVVLGGDNDLQMTTSSQTTRQTITQDSTQTLAFERRLCVQSHPFLQSHVMNGHAVLPLAMIIEWLAHGALHLNLGMQFHGFDDLRLFKGVTLNGQEQIPLQIFAKALVQKGDLGFVEVELRSLQQLHASAVIILGDQTEHNRVSKLKQVKEHYQYQQGEYYQNGQLFHGQHLRGIKQVLACCDEGIVANVCAAPSPTAWMKQAIRSGWLADPLVLDSAFQMMILWSFEQQGIGSLPTAIRRYRQYQARYPDSVQVVVKVNEQTAKRALSTLEFLSDEGKLIATMDGYECVRDPLLKQSFKNNQLVLED